MKNAEKAQVIEISKKAYDLLGFLNQVRADLRALKGVEAAVMGVFYDEIDITEEDDRIFAYNGKKAGHHTAKEEKQVWQEAREAGYVTRKSNRCLKSQAVPSVRGVKKIRKAFFEDLTKVRTMLSESIKKTEEVEG